MPAIILTQLCFNIEQWSKAHEHQQSNQCLQVTYRASAIITLSSRFQNFTSRAEIDQHFKPHIPLRSEIVLSKTKIANTTIVKDEPAHRKLPNRAYYRAVPYGFVLQFLPFVAEIL